MCVYLLVKFQAPSLILTSFIDREDPTNISKWTPKEGICLKLDIQGKGRLKIFDIDRKWVRSFENYTIFRDVVCVSFLNPTVKCEICWKLAKAKTDWCYWHRSVSFFVNPGLGGLLRDWFWGGGITYARKLKLGT